MENKYRYESPMIKEKNSIHIVISGIGLKLTNDLKLMLREIIPEAFPIKWTNIADSNIHLLIVNSNFLDFDGIKRLLDKKDMAYLKIAKDDHYEGQFIENTLYTPCHQSEELKTWMQKYVLNFVSIPEGQAIPEAVFNTQINAAKDLFSDYVEHVEPAPHAFNLAHLQHLYQYGVGKIHVYDDHGTLAIADVGHKFAWLDPEREDEQTNKSFNYHFAKTTELTKVSRKKQYNLNDWLWNLFWRSPECIDLAPLTGCYKIDFWPQPWHKAERKDALRLSACFIQGADLHLVHEQLHIPEATVRRFIAACMAANNGRFITAADCGYQKPQENLLTRSQDIAEEDTGIKKIFGKLRKYFGL